MEVDEDIGWVIGEVFDLIVFFFFFGLGCVRVVGVRGKNECFVAIVYLVLQLQADILFLHELSLSSVRRGMEGRGRAISQLGAYLA